MRFILGIDWGTWNSAAALYSPDSGRPVMIQSDEAAPEYGKAFPSFIYFDAFGGVKAYGRAAMGYKAVDPSFVVWGVKRLIGLSYREAQSEGDLDRFEFKTEPADDGGILIAIGEKKFSPTDICELTLRKIKTDAESNRNCGAPIDEAVLTVPSYFDDTRTQEIVKAANKVGFANVNTVTEPAAAALAYEIPTSESQYVTALSIGAGTFEVAVGMLTKSGLKNQPVFMAKGISGNTRLGGIDMDDALITYVIQNKAKENWVPKLQSLFKEHGEALDTSELELKAKIREEIERIKIALSERIEGQIGLEHNGATVLKGTLTRIELEEAIMPVLERCQGAIVSALDKSSLTKRDIDNVLLIGGPMRMPVVRSFLRKCICFEDDAVINPKLEAVFKTIEEGGFPVDPMKCVAVGAALSSGAPTIIEPTPYGYGSTHTVKRERLPDGSERIIEDYAPMIQADSTQTEGSISFRYNTDGISQGVYTVHFNLIACYKVHDEISKRLRYEYRELGSYQFRIPRATPRLRFTLRRDHQYRRLDLIAKAPEIEEGEWPLHELRIRTGIKREFPEEYDVAPVHRRELDEQKLRAELIRRIADVEKLGRELVLECQIRMTTRNVSYEMRSRIDNQIARLNEALESESTLQSITTDRFIKMSNQMYAVINDMETAQPPLLTSSEANEWKRKIPQEIGDETYSID
jgi:molecular chaperone DnaK (HSP70)